jgi:hypothetical protein
MSIRIRIFCLLFFSFNLKQPAFSQSTFLKFFPASHNYRHISNADELNDSTFLAIDNEDLGACSDLYSVLVLNKFGNTISTIPQSGSTSDADFLERAPYGSFYCVGDDSYCGDSAIIYVSNLGLSGSPFWLNRISQLTVNSTIGVMFGPDSSITIRYWDVDAKQHFLKYSHLGVVLSHKTFRFGDRYAFMVNSYNDNYYLARNSIDSLGIRRIKFIKLDSNIDSLTSYTLLSDSISYLTRIKKLKNGNILLLGWKTTPSNQIMAEIDTLGNFIWSKNYFWKGGKSITSICQRNDSGLTFAVKANASTTYLLKCSNQGDSLSSKIYQMVQGFTIQSVKQTSDSGYIIAGESGSYSKGFVLKTDANGDTGTINLGYSNTMQIQLKIFPNPSAALTKIDYSGLDKYAVLQMENIYGQLVFTKKLEYPDQAISFDAGLFQPGMYFCNLLGDGLKPLIQKFVVAEH